MFCILYKDMVGANSNAIRRAISYKLKQNKQPSEQNLNAKAHPCYVENQKPLISPSNQCIKDDWLELTYYVTIPA